MSSLKNELQSNHTTRWQAIGLLKHIFSSAVLSWQLKEHAIDFVFCITSGDTARTSNDEHGDYSSYMPGLCTALQGIIMVIIYSTSTVLRKNAFGALRRVLADSPNSQKLDLFQGLIANSDSSSMIAILLGLFRGELHSENCKRTSKEKSEVLQADNQDRPTSSLWTAGVLELVDLVLKSPKGGPPLLPEASDAKRPTTRECFPTITYGEHTMNGFYFFEYLLLVSDPDLIDAVCS